MTSLVALAVICGPNRYPNPNLHLNLGPVLGLYYTPTVTLVDVLSLLLLLLLLLPIILGHGLLPQFRGRTIYGESFCRIQW